MKIMHVSNGNRRLPLVGHGGSERVLWEISRKLASMGHEVTVMDRKRSAFDPSVDIVEGVRIVRLKAPKINTAIPYALMLNEIFFGFRTSHFLSMHNYDVIHIHHPFIGLVITSKFKKNTVYTSHQAIWSLDRPSTLGKRIFKPLETLVMRKVGKVIALNDIYKRKFVSETGIPLGNIIVVPNGVDTNLFTPSITNEDIYKKYPIDRGDKVLLFVGRMVKDKGVEYLIKSAYTLCKKHKDIKFLLVGPCEGMHKPYTQNIIELINKYDLRKRIRILGSVSVDDLRNLYAVSNIFVLPSIAEANPLVTLEAMASGKPIIATKVGGVPFQIKDGWNGFLVEPRNEKLLTEKIEYLLENPQMVELFGKRSRKLAEEEFSWDKIAENLVEIYNSMVIGFEEK